MRDINQGIGKGPQCKGCKFTTDPKMVCSNPQICIGGSLHERMTDYEIFLHYSRPVKLDADTIKAGVRQEPPVNDLVTYNNFWKTNQTFDFDKMTKEEVKYDMINHPRHYKTKNGLEAIDVIEAFTDGLEGIEATDTGNVIKYILRWKHKNGVEDLKKIIWYTNHLIKHLDPEHVIDKKDNENHFKCPKCGGNIIRDMVPVGNTTYALPSDPYCIDCGIHYVIKIEEDLTYEIIPMKNFTRK